MVYRLLALELFPDVVPNTTSSKAVLCRLTRV